MEIEVIDNNDINTPFFNSLKRELIINSLHDIDLENPIEYPIILTENGVAVCVINNINVLDRKLKLTILNTYNGKILKSLLESGFKFENHVYIDLNKKVIFTI